MEKRYKVKRPEIIDESADNEKIIVNLETGAYFNFNPMATVIWDFFMGEETDAVISEKNIILWSKERCENIHKGIDDEIKAFLNNLKEEGLIIDTYMDETKDIKLGEGKITYSIPEYHKFTDLEELLSLDPIHDVNEEGWPNK